MSGGHFDYKQFEINMLYYDIERYADKNEPEYSPEILVKFKEAVEHLKTSSEMVHIIDYLICGDYGEETFHREWADRVEK